MRIKREAEVKAGEERKRLEAEEQERKRLEEEKRIEDEKHAAEAEAEKKLLESRKAEQEQAGRLKADEAEETRLRLKAEEKRQLKAQRAEKRRLDLAAQEARLAADATRRAELEDRQAQCKRSGCNEDIRKNPKAFSRKQHDKYRQRKRNPTNTRLTCDGCRKPKSKRKKKEEVPAVTEAVRKAKEPEVSPSEETNGNVSTAGETNGASTASDSNDTEGDKPTEDPEVNADTTHEPSGNSDGETNGSTSAIDSMGEPASRGGGDTDRNVGLWNDIQASDSSSRDSADRKAEEPLRKAEEAKNAEDARQKAEAAKNAEEARKHAEQNAKTAKFWGVGNKGKTWIKKKIGERVNHTYLYAEKVAIVDVPAGVTSVKKEKGKQPDGSNIYKTVFVDPSTPVTRRRLCDSPVLAALMQEIAACQ